MDRLLLRPIAVACLAGTVAFSFFFFAVKRWPALATIAAFGDDPYDTVGYVLFRRPLALVRVG